MATTINVYLNFDGNCEEAFNFYKSIFGGEFSYLGRFKDMPAEEPVPEDMKERIMHIALPFTSDINLMGSDIFPGFSEPLVQGNNVSLSIKVDSEDDARRVFDSLSVGGVISMPLEKTFWNSFFGMFTDKYGIHWMVAYDYE